MYYIPENLFFGMMMRINNDLKRRALTSLSGRECLSPNNSCSIERCQWTKTLLASHLLLLVAVAASAVVAIF